MVSEVREGTIAGWLNERPTMVLQVSTLLQKHDDEVAELLDRVGQLQQVVAGGAE